MKHVRLHPRSHDRRARRRRSGVVVAAASLAAGLIGLVGPGVAIAAPTTAFTYANPGTETPFPVPAGVTSLHVVATGGAGGNGELIDGVTGAPLQPGGKGARVVADLTVVPGDVLYVEVGRRGVDEHFVPFTFEPSTGGGASDIRRCSNVDTSPGCLLTGTGADPRLVVAGGGGGGASPFIDPPGPAGSGGDAVDVPPVLCQASDGAAGDANVPAPGGGGGFGGSCVSPGSGGSSPNGVDGTAGTAGFGGAGGVGSSVLPGGGGGDGFFGGGGGGSANQVCNPPDCFTSGPGGGGGGSSFAVDPFATAVNVTAPPSVTISFVTPPGAGTGNGSTTNINITNTNNNNNSNVNVNVNTNSANSSSHSSAESDASAKAKGSANAKATSTKYHKPKAKAKSKGQSKH